MISRPAGVVALFCLACVVLRVHAADRPLAIDPDSPEALTPATAPTGPGRGTDWFLRDRFGMMIHWNLAAVPESRWAEIGVTLPAERIGDPSWYFCRFQIPVATWRRLAEHFNPKQYNADQWVSLAREAGMKYLVYVAKHHDGFAMYDSAHSTFDVVDATPFARDPLKELAAACHRHGIRLGLYYSQAQDWEHPDGAGNDWDYPAAGKDFARYFEQKCKPQVRELLTRYGPIGLIWFDTPVAITAAQSRELYDLVKSIQPDCLVNSRIGNGVGDYMSAGDSAFPDATLTGLWETACTSSRHWVFMEDDAPRMSSGEVVGYLVHNVSRGGNLLLNFGPDDQGRIPQRSADLLRGIGKWMSRNGEAIYGAASSPFHAPFEWGTVTTRPGVVYLHVTRRSGDTLRLYGLESRVRKVTLLANGRETRFDQRHDAAADLHVLSIDLPPGETDSPGSVLRVDIKGDLAVQPFAMPDSNGMVRVHAMHAVDAAMPRRGLAARIAVPGFAQVHRGDKRPMLRLTEWGGGYIENWTEPSERLSWRAKIVRPGDYHVFVVTSKVRGHGKNKGEHLWEGGHAVRVEVGARAIEGTIREEVADKPLPFRTVPDRDKVTRLGRLRVESPGENRVVLRLVQSASEGIGTGLSLRSLVLVPTEGDPGR